MFMQDSESDVSLVDDLQRIAERARSNYLQV